MANPQIGGEPTMSHLVGFFMFNHSPKRICNACKGTLKVAGMSGALKDCPRCIYPITTAQREAKQKRHILKGAWTKSHAKGPTRFVLVAMASHVDPEGICILTVDRLAQFCGCSRRAVKDARAELLLLGEIVVIDNHGGSGIGGAYRMRDLTKGCI